ncbi:MAG: hypothetical protein M3256_23055, partial [Actinomycetota bacterium]|nr:hypothetical protein [Actinomycetota bacterium]
MSGYGIPDCDWAVHAAELPEALRCAPVLNRLTTRDFGSARRAEDTIRIWRSRSVRQDCPQRGVFPSTARLRLLRSVTTALLLA